MTEIPEKLNNCYSNYVKYTNFHFLNLIFRKFLILKTFIQFVVYFL